MNLNLDLVHKCEHTVFTNALPARIQPTGESSTSRESEGKATSTGCRTAASPREREGKRSTGKAEESKSPTGWAGSVDPSRKIYGVGEVLGEVTNPTG